MRINFTFIRFLLVGTLNTLVDMSTFLALRHFGAGIILANLWSTSIALIVSFILNSSFTFKTDSSAREPRRAALFVGITLIGLWILQPLIIEGVLFANDRFAVPKSILESIRRGAHIEAGDIVAKLAAIGVTLIWNYFWYSKVIFAKKKGPKFAEKEI